MAADDSAIGAVESPSVQVEGDGAATSVLSQVATAFDMRWQCPSCGTRHRLQSADLGGQVSCLECGADFELDETILVPPTAEPAPSSAPERGKAPLQKMTAVGKYPVERFLGRGGMGEIWLGRHPNLDIPVAVKILSSEMVGRSPRYVDRFIKEARTAAQVNHPNIVRIYDAGRQDGVFFIVLEYMDGGDVLTLANKHEGRLPVDQALGIVISVAEALAEAAKYKIIHRDIKPDNIMLTRDGQVKLADLGIAKHSAAHDDENRTFTNMLLGTPAYIAPEQALNASEVDGRADIYSLGATFYRLVTGAVPFPAKSPFHMMYKHVKEPLVHPKSVNPDLPDNICAVICKMMEKDPASRYQDPQSLLLDLYRIRDHNAPSTDLEAWNLPARNALRRRQWTKILHAAAWVAVCAVTLLAGFALRNHLIALLGLDSESQRLRPLIDRLAGQRLEEARSRFRRQLAGTVSPAGPVGPPAEVRQASQPREAVPVTAAAVAGQGDPPPPDPSALAQERCQVLRPAAESKLRDLLAAGLDELPGLADRLVAAKHRLADAQVALLEEHYERAALGFQEVIDECGAVAEQVQMRDEAKRLVAELKEAREAAVVVGGAEKPELQDAWVAAESKFNEATDALTKGIFREARTPAAQGARMFRALAAKVPQLTARNGARDAFYALYDNAPRAAMEQYAPELFQRVEEQRRLADAAADYEQGAGRYVAARAALEEASARAMAQSRAAEETQRAAAAQKQAAAAWEGALAQVKSKMAEITRLKGDPSQGGRAVLLCDDALQDVAELAKKPGGSDRAPELAALTAQLKALMAAVVGTPRPGHAWLIPGPNIELVAVAPGVYQCGSARGSPDETPVHSVALSRPFWIGRYEVTQEQYMRVVGSNPSSLRHGRYLPVETVDWNAASGFCQRLTEREAEAGRLPDGYVYRLPTEAEWEYACRAGSRTEFSFGDDDGELFRYGNYCDLAHRGATSWRDTKHNDHHDKTAPVGSYEPNAWGIYDMHGNVAEWCYDSLGEYPSKQVFDPCLVSTSRPERIFRGGAWDGAAALCRSAERSAIAAAHAADNRGFRIVLAPRPSPTAPRSGWGGLFHR